MSAYQGLTGLSISARGIPPRGLKTNGAKLDRSKYKDFKQSEQKYTSGQRRMLRKEKT